MKSQVQKINIQQNVSLAPFTTFKIGGPAKHFVEVSAEEALLEALEFAKKNNLEIFVLGGGANILFSDQGFDGLVIKLQVARYKIQDTKIECGAGCRLSQIVKEATDHSLTGLEWAAGIPGTVGGAIWGNAGAYGSEMKDVVESVKIIEMQNANLKMKNDNVKYKMLKNSECQFAYRDSIFKKNKNLIIVSCVLKLQKGDMIEIENKIKEIVKKRVEKIPKEQSAGSFFQNPTVENPEIIVLFEKDMGAKCRDNKIPAGWLIEELGLRGKKIGGAMVSEKHCNFIVNLGNATAEDVVMLASLIKMKVRNEFGIQLKEEVQYVGF